MTDPSVAGSGSVPGRGALANDHYVADLDSSTDTAPQQAIDLPYSAAAAGRAAGQVSTALLVRALIAGAAALALAVVAVLLFRHGIRPGAFPPYAAGTSRTVVDRYSGPWIGGSAAALLLACLAGTSCAADVFRRVRLQRARRPD